MYTPNYIYIDILNWLFVMFLFFCSRVRLGRWYQLHATRVPMGGDNPPWPKPPTPGRAVYSKPPRASLQSWTPHPMQRHKMSRNILLMDKILHDRKDSKLWELWYIPYYGSCRILSISRKNHVWNPCFWSFQGPAAVASHPNPRGAAP